jgi:hypothetical protein
MGTKIFFFKGEGSVTPPKITYYGRELVPTRVEAFESGNGYFLYFAGQDEVYLPLSMLAQQMSNQGYVFRGYDAGRFGEIDEYQCIYVERRS